MSTYLQSEKQVMNTEKHISGEDRTPIELFIAGVRGWELDMRRHFPGKLGEFR